MILPDTEATPLIRTDFTSDEAWREVVEAATGTSEHGFRANLAIVESEAFQDADLRALAELAESTTQHVLLVVADTLTMTDPERTLLCIDPLSHGECFRVIPSELWGMENNVSLANMDFAEFASAADPDGVFRGFTE